MDLRRWLDADWRHRTFLILAALLGTFAGVDLLLNRPEGSWLQWLGVPLLAGGGSLLAVCAWPTSLLSQKNRTYLANRFIRTITWHGRLVPYFPVIGISILFADLGYNAILSPTPALLTEDTIFLMGGCALILYGFVPIRYAKERDFLLVFFIVLNSILVLPLLLARVMYADVERSVDLYSWVALDPQTGAILNLLGVANTVHAVAGSTAPGLTFSPRNLSIQVTVVITPACYGIYPCGIFAAAFTSFVLTEYERASRRIWVLLVLGSITAYVANVLRMVSIVLVGYYTDTPGTDLQNMLIAHSYLGWLIFIGWIAPFWMVVLKYVSPRPEVSELSERRTHGSRCARCDGAMSPLVQGCRCGCGRLYHA